MLANHLIIQLVVKVLHTSIKIINTFICHPLFICVGDKYVKTIDIHLRWRCFNVRSPIKKCD